jgi:hypothetical protein
LVTANFCASVKQLGLTLAQKFATPRRIAGGTGKARGSSIDRPTSEVDV